MKFSFMGKKYRINERGMNRIYGLLAGGIILALEIYTILNLEALATTF